MSSAILNLRKHWLALSAIAALVAIALTAGALFAANERQQAEPPMVSQQSTMAATDPVPAVAAPEAQPVPERVSIQPADNEEEEDDLPIVKAQPRYPNLDSNLNRLAEQAQAAGQQSSVTHSSDPGGDSSSSSDSTSLPEPVLVTFYVEPEQLAAVQQFLEDNDVFIRHVGADWIEALVPPALLPTASELPGVHRVDTVIPPQPAQSQGRSVSQGVALHHADAWHRMGYRGEGVKVGIIDSGFEKIRELQGRGELPGNVMARCYPPLDSTAPVSSSLADCEVDGSHGTAVTETIIDVAPEVQLYIAHPQSGGDLRDAVDWMVENEVHVINRSLGSIFQGPGDGTSYFSNGVIRSVDAAVAGGIVFVNAAGNSARKTWHGKFSDPDGNDWLNFTSRDASNSFYLPFDEESSSASRVTAFMRWDDSWGGADCNLDLYLSKVGSNGKLIDVDYDVEVQDGGDADIPRAIVSFEADSANDAGFYHLFIHKRTCADEPSWIQLHAWLADELQYYFLGYSLTSEADSRNPGMLVVAAAHWGSPQAIASYSSRGPTIDGRIKPDITGIACGRSTVYDNRTSDGTECWFAGTSQAAPHVTGLAALVKQRFPDYTPAQVADYLKKHANDHERGPLGADNTWGHGLASLPPGPAPERRGSLPTGNLDWSPGQNPGEVVISWDPVPEATHYRIGYVNLEVDYNLVTQASCTRERDDWLQAFVYVDVKEPNVPVNEDGRAEYTIRRLTPGAAHTFTVLTSNNLYDNKINVGAEFTWAELGKRWARLPGRNTLPPGILLPQLDCDP